MDLEEFIRLADHYAHLGWAVIEQLKEVADDPSEEVMAEQNPNALRMALDWLRDAQNSGIEGCEAVADDIQRYLGEEDK